MIEPIINMIVAMNSFFLFVLFDCKRKKPHLENTNGIKERNVILIMGKRITIVLDEDLLKKLRILQAKQIKDSATSVSFSKIINETLKKSFKN